MAHVSTDTSFVELSKALFGDTVDHQALLAKMSPSPSDVHIMGTGEAPRALRPTGRRRKLVKVDKSQKSLTSGMLVRMRRLTGASVKPLPGTNALQTSEARQAAAGGKQAKASYNSYTSTTTGKVAVAGGGALAAKKVLGGRGGGQEQYGDPYAYAKSAGVDDVVWAGTFAKLDEDKRLAFGWASVVEVNGLPVVDRQGDYISIDDIEEAAYVYVEKSRVGGDMHRRVGGKSADGEDRPHHAADMVESMVFTPEKISKLGLPDDFPVGWWCGFRVFDDDAWSELKSGNRTGFSVHGKGIRKSIDYDSLMGSSQ